MSRSIAPFGVVFSLWHPRGEEYEAWTVLSSDHRLLSESQVALGEIVLQDGTIDKVNRLSSWRHSTTALRLWEQTCLILPKLAKIWALHSLGEATKMATPTLYSSCISATKTAVNGGYTINSRLETGCRRGYGTIACPTVRLGRCRCRLTCKTAVMRYTLVYTMRETGSE